VFLIIGINLKMVVALFLSGFFVQARWWIKWLSLLFILPWAVPSIPTILSCASCSIPEWGVINSLIFRLTGEDGPNWLNDPTLALSHGDAGAHLEVAAVLDPDPDRRAAGDPGRAVRGRSVDGATNWQKFRFITWPSMRTLYLTCTILSMIWTLGDFNSVYLLTGGGPADLTHVLATLGIRYLRLDQVDLSMASIVVALPLVLPLVYFMMKRLSK
jgi:multiple sugar transport system permease protein